MLLEEITVELFQKFPKELLPEGTFEELLYELLENFL